MIVAIISEKHFAGLKNISSGSDFAAAMRALKVVRALMGWQRLLHVSRNKTDGLQLSVETLIGTQQDTILSHYIFWHANGWVCVPAVRTLIGILQHRSS